MRFLFFMLLTSISTSYAGDLVGDELRVANDEIRSSVSSANAWESFLSESFVEVPNQTMEGARKINLHMNRSSHYDILCLPEAPIVHPYNPFDVELIELSRKNFGILNSSFNVKLPTSAYANLPQNIKDVLRHISPERTDIFWLTQDNPWGSIDLLLRPHTWIKKEGVTSVQVGVFSNDSSVTMRGYDSIHEGTSHTHDGVSSPNNMQIDGLDYHVTKSFYPVVIDGDRAAVALIWMLNDEDQLTIESLSLRTNNMQQLMAALGGIEKFSTLREELNSLLQP